MLPAWTKCPGSVTSAISIAGVEAFAPVNCAKYTFHFAELLFDCLGVGPGLGEGVFAVAYQTTPTFPAGPVSSHGKMLVWVLSLLTWTGALQVWPESGELIRRMSWPLE